MKALCLDCFATEMPDDAHRCPACRGPRVRRHAELHALSIAHLDCDAFYASVEKRDNPELRDKPVIIGGGKRGVVSTACYIARTFGVKSAMPMFKALKACPEAVVVKPNMQKYVAVSREVRALMGETTPAVETLSLDEAFLDLTGTERLHKQTPAVTLAKLARRIEDRLGITVSVGISHNKFLAKIASDLDKPRGFAAIGKAETLEFLRDKPVTLIFGVGKAFAASLAKHGITRIGHLQAMDESDLMKRFGSQGLRLARLARGEDARIVDPDGETKSVSAEDTFFDDLATLDELDAELWPLCERVSARAKKSAIGGQTITLKLKTADFKLRTRSVTLEKPTQLAETLYTHAHDLLAREIDGTKFRLIGVGISHLAPAEACDLPDLLDPKGTRRAGAERAMDKVREKFGRDVIKKGRGLETTRSRK